MIKQSGHHRLHPNIQDGSHLKGQLLGHCGILLPTKINLGKKQRQPKFGGNGVGFLGPRSQGVSLEVDEMISNQVAPIREVNVVKLMT